MQTYLARQAVCDRNKNIVAYELLHRVSRKNKYPVGVSDEEATCKVIINSFFNSELNNISDGKPVWINFNESMIRKGFAELLPSDKVVIEILESVEPLKVKDEIISLYKKGYKVALDDFIYHPDWNDLLKFISIIKIDLLATSVTDAFEIIKKVKNENPKIKVLAEKVEDKNKIDPLLNGGFDFIQGYCLHTPEVYESNNALKTPERIIDYYQKAHLDYLKYRNEIIKYIEDNNDFDKCLKFYFSNFSCNKKNLNESNLELILLIFIISKFQHKKY